MDENDVECPVHFLPIENVCPKCSLKLCDKCMYAHQFVDCSEGEGRGEKDLDSEVISSIPISIPNIGKASVETTALDGDQKNRGENESLENKLKLNEEEKKPNLSGAEEKSLEDLVETKENKLREEAKICEEEAKKKREEEALKKAEAEAKKKREEEALKKAEAEAKEELRKKQKQISRAEEEKRRRLFLEREREREAKAFQQKLMEDNLRRMREEEEENMQKRLEKQQEKIREENERMQRLRVKLEINNIIQKALYKFQHTIIRFINWRQLEPPY